MNRVLVKLLRGLREDSGQSLVLGTISLSAVTVFVALAIDVGQLHYQQQEMQAAVDAAALSGALEMNACGSTRDCAAMTTAAQVALSENGLTVGTPLKQCASNSSKSLTLTVNNGPCALGSASADPNYGNAGYVEAVLSGPASSFFARILGFNAMQIMVRAEASGVPPSYCLIASADSASTTQGITLQGGSSGGINAPNCGIYDDDPNTSNALVNNSGSVTDQKFMVVGGKQNSGATFSSNPVTGAATLPDPLSYLTANNDAPTAGSCTSPNTSSSTTLSHGTYCGMSVNSGVTVTLNPGTYVFEGNVTVGGNLTGTSGVTLYMASGQLNFNSGSTVKLTAPTSGTLSGIAIWQASGDTDEMNLDAGSTSSYNGAIYAPTAELTLNSASNAAACTLVDVGSVMLDSGASFSIGNSCSAFSSSQAFKTGTSAIVE